MVRSLIINCKTLKKMSSCSLIHMNVLIHLVDKHILTDITLISHLCIRNVVAGALPASGRICNFAAGGGGGCGLVAIAACTR